MSYIVTAEFDDEQAARSLVESAKKLGAKVTELTVTKEETAIVQPKPLPLYHLYAIKRGEEVGYIGKTKADPPNARLDQHLSTATNPFYPWLNCGVEQKDIEVEFYNLGRVKDADANNKEKWAIRRLQPVYNRTGKLPLVEVGNGNLLSKALDDL